MALLRIQGGSVLHGEISASSAKNSVINLIAAALLADEPVTLLNVPHLRDVSTMIELLGHMGVVVVVVGELQTLLGFRVCFCVRVCCCGRNFRLLKTQLRPT